MLTEDQETIKSLMKTLKIALETSKILIDAQLNNKVLNHSDLMVMNDKNQKIMGIIELFQAKYP